MWSDNNIITLKTVCVIICREQSHQDVSFDFYILFDLLQEAFQTLTQLCVTSMSSHAVWKFSGSVVITANKNQMFKG